MPQVLPRLPGQGLIAFSVGKFGEATAQTSHVKMWPAERSIDVGIEGGAGYEKEMEAL